MAGRSHTNWNFYLLLLKMGVSQADAAPLVGVKPATPYVKAHRSPSFSILVDQAMDEGRRSIVVSPTYFALDGELLLDAHFNAIPRQPPNSLKSWALAELSRNPLAIFAH